MLILPEQLIINQVEDLYRQFDEIMGSGDDVRLDINNVKKVDTACLQLLCVVQKSLNATGHQISWIGSSEALHSTATMVGVDTYLQL